MKMIRTHKAWTINFSKIDEGYLFDQNSYVVYNNSKNKAKSELLKLLNYESIKLRWSDDEISYLNIPVVRYEEMDKYQFEGKSLTQYRIEEIKIERDRQERLDNILSDNKITHCYIKKGSYYRPGWAGYTDIQTRAGVYKKDEAVSHARDVSEISILPIDKNEHNSFINKEIEELKRKLI